MKLSEKKLRIAIREEIKQIRQNQLNELSGSKKRFFKKLTEEFAKKHGIRKVENFKFSSSSSLSFEYEGKSGTIYKFIMSYRKVGLNWDIGVAITATDSDYDLFSVNINYGDTKLDTNRMLKLLSKRVGPVVKKTLK